MTSTVSLNDLEELEKIISEVKNPELKQLLEQDARTWRSKLVTSLVNAEISKNSKTSAAPNVAKPEPPKISTRKPTKKDEDAYLLKQVKGYKEKIRSMQSTLPDNSADELADALIRCKGKEDAAIEGILSGELPKRPAIPQDFYKEFEEEQKKKNEQAQKQYEQQLKAYEASLQQTTSPTAEAPIVLPDITDPVNKDNPKIAAERVSILKAQITKQKEETDRLTKEVEKLKQKSGVTTKVATPSADNSGYNRLYLPGEYETIQNNEPRVFTFKPERTFANEVSHIHFRVAEAEFYRMLIVKNEFRVMEVKYLVTPHLVQKFESKRAQIAYELKKEFKDVKPILTFCPHEYEDIEWIRFNNFKPSASNGKGWYCTNDSSVTAPYITKRNEILLCLALPGKAHKVGNAQVASLQAGCHSSVTADGLHVKVYDQDQVLPYYIIKYEKPTVLQNQSNFNSSAPSVVQGIKLLDEEWKSMEQDAKADKFINDCMEFYQETLKKKDKERKLGDVNPSDILFQQMYQKRYEREKKFLINGLDDVGSPTTPATAVDPFDVDEETPVSAGSQDFASPNTATKQNEDVFGGDDD